MKPKKKDKIGSSEIVTDEKAPKVLRLTITDKAGNEWGELIADSKNFASGSKGFYATGKLTNPDSDKKYQVGCNIILIGSKPKE